jgi:hypothetical protein
MDRGSDSAECDADELRRQVQAPQTPRHAILQPNLLQRWVDQVKILLAGYLRREAR